MSVEDQMLIKTLQELIRIDTTNDLATEYKVVAWIESFLAEQGIPSQRITSPQGRVNLIATLQPARQLHPPLVLLSHLDVVAAESDDWKNPPFSGRLAEDCIWGRGTLDTKQLTAMHLHAFCEVKEQSEYLTRAVHLVCTADEENGSKEGMEWVATKRPELFQNATVLSEGGGFTTVYADKPYMLYAAAEKGTAMVEVTAVGDGGHAGSPPEDQAVFRLAETLGKLLEKPLESSSYPVAERFQAIFPNKKDQSEHGKLIEQLRDYMVRPTVTVDSIDMGQASNVIPYKASARLEVRTLPHQTRQHLEDWLTETFDVAELTWEVRSFEQGYESECDAEIIHLLQQQSHIHGFTGEWVPFTALGRTDGRFIAKEAQAIYGVSPLTLHFTEVLKRVHGVDERIEKAAFLFGAKVLKEVIKEMSLERGRQYV